MKRRVNYSKKDPREKERQRVLDNFYTKKIKNGKTTRADYLDRIFLNIFASLVIIFLVNKLIGNFIISLFIGIILIVIISKYLGKISKRNRLIKIEEIKKEYKIKLEEEKVLSPDGDIEDYIIERYYEKKAELKFNMNFLGKDKIFRLYFLFIIFFIGSHFVSYSIYYKVMAIIAFTSATFIGSYNLTEYLRKRGNKDLLNEDIDV